MKFRMSFVTNSSSSSYICAFGKIEDNEKAMKFIKANDILDYVFSGTKVIEKLKKKWDKIGADWAGVYIDITESDIDVKADYIMWESFGGAGDEDDDWSDRDYDVDADDFTDQEQAIFNGVEEQNGFTEVQSGYGAGRNG